MKELDVRYANHPDDSKHYTTEELRRHYLIEKVFVEDDISLTYSHQDRIIAGGAYPVHKELVLEAGDAGQLTEGLPHVHVCGVMAMASLTDDMEQVAREFDLVRRTYITLKDGCFDESEYFNELSMGMSDDWQIAVKYGATLVRIGTAIFGPRKY